MIEEKQCNVCNESKTLDCFYYRNDTKKYRDNCKKCKPINNKLAKQARTSKVCKTCSIDKPLSDYQFAGGGRWLQPYCKPCDADRKRKYVKENYEQVEIKRKKHYQDNKESINAKSKIWATNNAESLKVSNKAYRIENKERIAARDKKYNIENSDKIKAKTKETRNIDIDLSRKKEQKYRDQYLLNNSEKIRAYNKQYKINNADKLAEYKVKNLLIRREQKRIYCNMKTATDVNFKLLKNLRSRTRLALNSNVKSESTEKLLGCTIPFFKEYFKSLFTADMSWQAFPAGDIHIDHIQPCMSFELSSPEQQKLCFNYKNLQPLWALDNLKKGTKSNYQKVAA